MLLLSNFEVEVLSIYCF